MQAVSHSCGRWIFIAVFGFIGATVAFADEAKEPIGRWRYKDDSRPVKVIVIGGSVAHWGQGSFGSFLQTVCRNIELKNRAKTGYGAPKLKLRFRRQFLQNPYVKLSDPSFEYWLLFQGGLNSIYSPEMTIKFVSEMFALAHKSNVSVAALSLTPWGSSKSSKWKGLAGLVRHDSTRKVVSYLMGELPRDVALGHYVKDADKERAEWNPGELPDIAVNLFDGPMRDSEASVRDRDRLLRALKRKRNRAKKYPNVEEAAERAASVPQWFLRKEFRAFDHIHPNTEGHRVMAKEACGKLPDSWGCDCARLDRLTWTKAGFVESTP